MSASPTAGLVVGERARRTFSTFTFQYCVRELHPPQRSGGRNTDYANQSLPRYTANLGATSGPRHDGSLELTEAAPRLSVQRCVNFQSPSEVLQALCCARSRRRSRKESKPTKKRHAADEAASLNRRRRGALDAIMGVFGRE